ncbi:hypothetical protein VT98_12792 [Candidatus Electrothrix communis]|uniref:Uncharacterized protein n=1 Tax=Candidatus Electrothrix communis TaxID=1859133 RepID=A0A3S3U903_9BACT|nr:hypothetical protein VT98_12792 [Candidatus Electrothrix communis]
MGISAVVFVGRGGERISCSDGTVSLQESKAERKVFGFLIRETDGHTTVKGILSVLWVKEILNVVSCPLVAFGE